MQKLKLIIQLVLVFLFSFELTFGQTEMPSSTIHIIRGAKLKEASCITEVSFSNQQRFTLAINGIINFKIYSEGDILITLDMLCAPTESTSLSTKSYQLTVPVKRGNEYFVFYNAGKLEELNSKDGSWYLKNLKNLSKQEENLEYPINKNSLKNITKKDGKGQGTCFLISVEGFLLTNYHCVEGANEITVRGIEGDFTTKYKAVVIGSDPSNDLAILKLSNKNLKFSSLPYSIRSSGVSQAEKVYAIGYPKAEAMGEEVKVTDGIISSKSGAQGDMSKFQISAAVNPGNSGGPLIDENGNLIGVIYAKSTIAESAGYAIKASYLETFLKNIEEFNYPTYINTMKNKSLPEMISELKKIIFIIETN